MVNLFKVFNKDQALLAMFEIETLTLQVKYLTKNKRMNKDSISNITLLNNRIAGLKLALKAYYNSKLK